MTAAKLSTLTPGMIGVSYLGLAYHSDVDFAISRSETCISLTNTLDSLLNDKVSQMIIGENYV